jgi:hypothetical protein
MSVKVKPHAIMALVLLIAVLVAGCNSSGATDNSTVPVNSSDRPLTYGDGKVPLLTSSHPYNAATVAAYNELKSNYHSLIGLPDRVAAIDKGIKNIDPHTVNQTVLDAYEAEIDSCIATLDECEASVRLYSTYQPISISQTNPQVTGAITRVNVKILGDAPGMAMGNLYIATSQALANAAQNAVRNQLESQKTMLATTRAGQLLDNINDSATGEAKISDFTQSGR